MTHEAFCFLCETFAPTLDDGRFRAHDPHRRHGDNVVDLRCCPGSELSPILTRGIAAHHALRGPRVSPEAEATPLGAVSAGREAARPRQ